MKAMYKNASEKNSEHKHSFMQMSEKSLSLFCILKATTHK